MAILFNCPYCTASIKVPDSAGGKIGRCPKCGTRVKVPRIAAPPTPASSSTPSEQAPPEHFSDVPDPDSTEPTPSAPLATPPEKVPMEEDLAPVPITPAPVEEHPGEFEFPQPEPDTVPADLASPSAGEEGIFIRTSDPAPNISAQLRQRRKGNWIKIVIPLFLGLILVGVGLGYLYLNQPTYQGIITGEVLEDATIEKLIPRNEIKFPSDQLDELLDSLRDNPESLMTPYRRLRIRGSVKGLILTVIPGEKGVLVRVDPRANKDLDQYIRKNAERFHEPQHKQMVKTVQQFCQDWQSTVGSGMQMGNLASYMDSLGSDALVAGLGYHTQALSRGTLYPCIYEDTQGRLYYFLPKGTKHFSIVERQFEDQTDSIFDHEFRFEVRLKKASKPPGQKPSQDKTNTKPPEPTDDETPDDSKSSEKDQDMKDETEPTDSAKDDES